MTIFDRASRYPDEDTVHTHVRAVLERDLSPERLGLPCIVASSRLDPKKNHLGLVRAFAHSPDLRQRANLVIVTGNIEDPLRDYRHVGETERVVLDSLMAVVDQEHLRGQVSMFALRGQGQLAAGYRFFAALRSVFALTALYEPFGLAPLEAIAAGLPAVVTKFGGPSESLREGDEAYGLLVDPGDPEETSAALLSLVGKPDRWQQYAETGYRRVRTHYIWQRTAERYLDLIAQAVADPEARRSSERLPVHPYFVDPRPENDISLETLDDLYLKLDVPTERRPGG
jgi:sucrose-phosphate synthase